MELAHISDLHVTALLGPWWGLLSKRIIGAITLMRRAHLHAIMQAAIEDLKKSPPDHLAVTGDLTNLALDSELARARDYLAELAFPPERLTVIPGNHDSYVRGPHHARRLEHHSCGRGGRGGSGLGLARRGSHAFARPSSGSASPSSASRR